MTPPPRPEVILRRQDGSIFDSFTEPEAESFMATYPGQYVVHRRNWPSHAWPGGYPLFYTTRDGGCLCSKCANENIDATLGDDPEWQITSKDVNYEDLDLWCDNCNAKVEAAYGD